jgi:hypothetical protein
LRFIVDDLGFENRAEFACGGQHRWIEWPPPGAANTIALVPPTEGASDCADVARCARAKHEHGARIEARAELVAFVT